MAENAHSRSEQFGTHGEDASTSSRSVAQQKTQSHYWEMPQLGSPIIPPIYQRQESVRVPSDYTLRQFRYVSRDVTRPRKMTSLLFSAALAVSGCISAFCHRQLRTSLGRDVGENAPVTAAGLRYFASTKKMPGLQIVLAVWEKTEPMSDAYRQIDELSLRRKRNPRPWPYLPP